jgi:hypothetical protein
MFPLRDTIPSGSLPVVTVALIAVNTLVFFYEVQLGPALEQFLLLYGFVPDRYLRVAEIEPWNLRLVLDRCLPQCFCTVAGCT